MASPKSLTTSDRIGVRDPRADRFTLNERVQAVMEWVGLRGRGGVGMFCGMATNTARKGEEEKLVQAALEHAAALRLQPGCIAAYVLTEKGARTQVSLSIFESENAFNRGLDATRPVITKHHLEQILEGPSSFRLFQVR